MMTARRIVVLLAVAVVLGAGAVSFAETLVDEKLPVYKPVQGVSGTIKSEGSDTMNNLMTLWGEGFRQFYSNTQIEIQGKGSSTAPPALEAGTAAFGPMSRAMKASEIESFESRYGYKPTALRTAIDMLAVYVHKDNPIARRGLTLQEVDAIFSANRRGGFPDEIDTWGQLGLTGEWADKPISLYGRNAASGTYGYFKANALFGGDFKSAVKEQPGSSSVVQGVASDRFAIGYSGIGYKTADVVAVPLAFDADEDFVPATGDTAGDYPLSRFLYVYINHRPNARLDPLRGEMIRYMFSRQGQSAVLRDGYLPISAAIARQELKSVGLPADF